MRASIFLLLKKRRQFALLLVAVLLNSQSVLFGGYRWKKVVAPPLLVFPTTDIKQQNRSNIVPPLMAGSLIWRGRSGSFAFCKFINHFSERLTEDSISHPTSDFKNALSEISPPISMLILFFASPFPRKVAYISDTFTLLSNKQWPWSMTSAITA